MKAALDIELPVRDYLNEGGKLLVSGKYALFAQAANGAYFYNPCAPPECTTPAEHPCLPLLNDFQQYWLGAYTYVDGGGTDADGNPYPLTGSRRAVHRLHRHAQRARLGGEPGPHRVVPADVELPAAGRSSRGSAPARAGRLGPAGRAPVRPAHR